MSKAEKKAFTVRLRGSVITVSPWVHSSGASWWRFPYHDGEKWRYVTRAKKADAKAAAEKVLRELGEGFVWETLSVERKRFLARVAEMVGENDEAAVLELLASRVNRSMLDEVVEAYHSHKCDEKGEESPHLGQAKFILDELVKGFPKTRMVEIDGSALREWWKKRYGVFSQSRKKFSRVILVGFWKWARLEGHVGEGVSPAERLPRVEDEHGNRRVLSTDEMKALLRVVSEEFRVAIVLMGFAGFRPEEVAPSTKKKKNKRGLRAEDIDWGFKVIRVPAEVSKTGYPRVVPFNDALVSGLKWAGIEPGMKGVLCANNMSQARETLRLGKLVFGGKWPKDALRHTYGTARNSVLRNLPQVAEEMGTSESMLHRHYHNPCPREFGEEWLELNVLAEMRRVG